MPIFNFRCNNVDCHKHFERIMKYEELSTDSVKCPECQSEDLTRMMSSFGTYTINGNNDASTRPRGVARRKGRSN